MIDETTTVTPFEIIQGLVEQLGEQEWPYTQVRCPRSCCYDWKYKCPSCGELQEKGHHGSCQLSQWLKEGQAYLIENQPKEPSDDEPPTLWQRISSDETLPHHP